MNLVRSTALAAVPEVTLDPECVELLLRTVAEILARVNGVEARAVVSFEVSDRRGDVPFMVFSQNVPVGELAK